MGMNKYSRIFHHIETKNVKKRHAQMLEERHREAQRIRLEEIRLKYLIKERFHPRYSNWRSLFEAQMGTVGFVQTFVKGEGDTDLATIDSSDEASYAVHLRRVRSTPFWKTRRFCWTLRTTT